MLAISTTGLTGTSAFCVACGIDSKLVTPFGLSPFKLVCLPQPRVSRIKPLFHVSHTHNLALSLPQTQGKLSKSGCTSLWWGLSLVAIQNIVTSSPNRVPNVSLVHITTPKGLTWCFLPLKGTCAELRQPQK